MRLDGFGIFVEDMARMIRFYRDVLGFEIKESEDTSNVYLVKDGTLFLLYGRKDFDYNIMQSVCKSQYQIINLANARHYKKMAHNKNAIHMPTRKTDIKNHSA